MELTAQTSYRAVEQPTGFDEQLSMESFWSFKVIAVNIETFIGKVVSLVLSMMLSNWQGSRLVPWRVPTQPA
jgi:hypothetical protein